MTRALVVAAKINADKAKRALAAPRRSDQFVAPWRPPVRIVRQPKR
jgi:hypothetical protein